MTAARVGRHEHGAARRDHRDVRITSYNVCYTKLLRTDSFHLADEAVSVARTVIGQQYGAEFVPETPNFYQTKSKNAQEAHEAVRPTDATKISGSTLEVGDSRQEKLYQLIWRRFIACQMKSAIYDQTNIRIEAINPAEKSMVV